MAGLCTAAIFYIGLFACSWLCQAVGAQSVSVTAASNPTTCYTALITPQPTGVFCDNKRQALPVSGDYPFMVINIDQQAIYGLNTSNLANECRDACFEFKHCRSFQLFFGKHGLHPQCNLYNQTLEKLGLQNPPKGYRHAGQFFDQGCYTAECHISTGSAPPAKTCTPQYTQYIRDSSFESTQNYWHFQGTVGIVTDDPQNAFSGNNYVRFERASRTTPAFFSQKVAGLKYLETYLMRFAFRIANSSFPSRSCELSVSIEQNDASFATLLGYSSDPQFEQYYLYTAGIDVRTQGGALNFSFEVGCSSYPTAFFIDDITLTDFPTSCGFKLKIHSSDNRWNGQFLNLGNQLASVLQRGFVDDEATIWGLTSHGYIFTHSAIFPYNLLGFHSAAFSPLLLDAPMTYQSSPFLNCSIDASDILQCGSPIILYCIGIDIYQEAGFVDAAFVVLNASDIPSYCSPITLEAIYV